MAGVIFCSATVPYVAFASEITTEEATKVNELGIEADSSLNISGGEAELYTLTQEDDAIEAYLAEQGFNQYLQARGFVGGVIDAALIVLGVGVSAKSNYANNSIK